MMIRHARFNIYLCLAAALMLAGTGCKTKTPEEKKKAEEKKQITLLELHMEVTPDGISDNSVVNVGRESNTVPVNVEKNAFIDTASVDSAELVGKTNGPFSIRLKMNAMGTSLLDTETSMNPGRRIAVFASFGKDRWIAAPQLRKRISDGVFTFAPAASYEEAERIVRGLNNISKQMKKDSLFP